MKRCRDSRCKGGELPDSAFGVDRSQSDGLTRRCRECISRRRKELRKADPEKTNRYHREWIDRNPTRSMLRAAKQRAKAKNRPFALELTDIEMPKACPVFGTPFVLDGPRTDNSPSLDCVDPALGYVKGNVCVISWRANRIKCDGTLDELRAIVRYMEERMT